MADYISEFGAATVGIEDVDLTDTAGTTYASNVIDVRSSFLYTAIIDVNETGGAAAGDFKLTVAVVSKDGSTELYSFDLVTGMTSAADNQVVVTFGAGAGATLLGTGTLSTAADVLKVASKIKLTLEITTASDAATSCTASVQLLQQE